MYLNSIPSRWCLENMAGECLQTRFARHGLTPQGAPKPCPTNGVWSMLSGSVSRHGLLDTVKKHMGFCTTYFTQKGLEVCYCLWGVPSRPSPGSCPGPVQVPSRVRGGPIQIRHALCFTVFRTHPGPEVGAIPARPGPILLPSVPYRIRPGRAETDFLATSDSQEKSLCDCSGAR